MGRVKLGKEYVDTITGFRGIATSRTEWLFGCARVGIQPRVNDKGELPEHKVFDEAQLRAVKAKKPIKVSKPGGPRPVISKASVPLR